MSKKKKKRNTIITIMHLTSMNTNINNKIYNNKY